LDLDRVPQRETGMTPYEMMLSESQERMLLVAERGREDEVLNVFAKWGLDAVEVGRVTSDGKMRVLWERQVAAEIPAHALAEEAPVYQRPIAAPATPRGSGPLAQFAAEGANLTENFTRLLAWPAIASKRWIIEQYDHMVRTNTLAGPGAGDAAVLRIKGTSRALALTVDGNGRWCWLAPREGAKAAAAEAARNVACSGARPWAATNCLNFGNPEKPEVMWEFSECVDGIAEACNALGIPITGGNVSFYNDTLGQSIYPTPILGVLGLMEDTSHAMRMAFQEEGDTIILLDGLKTGSPVGEDPRREFSSSEYAYALQGVAAGTPPTVDLAAEKRLIEALLALAKEGSLRSAHDISEGGLALAVAESVFASQGLSAKVDIATKDPAEVALFGERGARAVVSSRAGQLARIRDVARQYEIGMHEIGQVTRGAFQIKVNGTAIIDAPCGTLRSAWADSLGTLMGA
jgi:phosphoribosylformylglycinamidine synthase